LSAVHLVHRQDKTEGRSGPMHQKIRRRGLTESHVQEKESPDVDVARVETHRQGGRRPTQQVQGS